MSISEATAVRAHDTASRPSPGTEELFSPYQLGDLDLDNRMVLSPMTRGRALEGNVPNPIAATY
jgi:2,4-dienoyl-CoA reductase-like NADH-dependent reductase (Old Yellow Enzyme family)